MLQAMEFKFWESIKLTMQAGGLESLKNKGIAADEMEKDIKRIEAYYRLYYMEDIELEKKVKKSYSSPEQAMKR